MVKKRQHGDGTVYQRGDGRYAADLRLPTGKKKTFYGATHQEASKKLNEAKRALEQGKLVNAPRQKLSDYLEYWLEVHRLEIKPSTYQNHTSSVHANIIPALGNVQLAKITTRHIQDFIALLMIKGLKASTVKFTFNVLKAALNDAVRWERLARNPCLNVTLPRIEDEPATILNQEQTRTLIKTVKGHALECMVILALTTAMRKGELCALHWNDIDFEARRLQVVHTLAYIAGQGFIEQDTKTSGSRRAILLTQLGIDALKRHRARQLEQRLQAGSSWGDNDLVFPNPTGGYQFPSVIHRMFKRLLVRSGLPDMKIHGLRHSAATFLLSLGIHPKVVQEILGHSTIAQTMGTYSHVLNPLHEDAMNILDKFLRANEG